MAACFACSFQKREPYANLSTLSNHELRSVPLGFQRQLGCYLGGEGGEVRRGGDRPNFSKKTF